MTTTSPADASPAVTAAAGSDKRRIIGLVLLLGMNVMTVAFGGAGVLLYTAGVTWIMWFVMDRY